jgi:hypothetical protein
MKASSLFIMLGVLGIAAVVISVRMERTDQKVMVQATKHVLQQIYDVTLSDSSKLKSGDREHLSYERLCDILLSTNRGEALASFIPPDDILLPRDGIALPSKDWLCIIRIQPRSFFGITGTGQSEAVNQSSLTNWTYRALSNYRRSEPASPN